MVARQPGRLPRAQVSDHNRVLAIPPSDAYSMLTLSTCRAILSRSSLGRACIASLLLHGVALGALAAWSIHSNSRASHMGAAAGVVVIDGAFSEPSPPADAAFAQQDVLILPQRAAMGQRHYSHESSDHVPLERMLPRDLLDRLLAEDRPAAESPRAIDKTSAAEFAMADVAYQEPASPPRSPSQRQPVVQTQAAVASESAPAVEAGVRTGPSFAGNRLPHYPPLAKARRWEGVVMLRIAIDRDGRVRRVEVARSSGYEILDAAAVAAVRTWRGIPATVGGTSIASDETLPVRFRLK